MRLDETRQVFNTLGETIHRRWRRVSYSEADFPALAHDLLAASEPGSRCDVTAIIDEAVSGQSLVLQAKGPTRFSDLSITMFRCDRFFIEALVWMDGSTSIHDHAFCGAFYVLEGSSIHTRYAFEPRHTINAQLSVGELVHRDTTILTRGDSHPIVAGRAFIHSLYHLARPSCTIVVRTPFLQHRLPQREYMRPGVSFDPFYQDPVLIRQTEALALALELDSTRAIERMEELARDSLYTGFAIVKACQEKLRELGAYDRVLSAIEDRHGDAASGVREALYLHRRQRDLVPRRAKITAPDLRYFLGILLTAPSRDTALELIRARAGTEPIDQIIDWLSELSLDQIGVVFDETQQLILRRALHLDSDEQVLDHLADEYSRPEVDASRAALIELTAQIRQCMPLRPLLRPSSPTHRRPAESLD